MSQNDFDRQLAENNDANQAAERARKETERLSAEQKAAAYAWIVQQQKQQEQNKSN